MADDFTDIAARLSFIGMNAEEAQCAAHDASADRERFSPPSSTNSIS